MNLAYLFAGIAAGSIVPWILMFIILRHKDAKTQESRDFTAAANMLLSERNEIGEREARALSGINASMALMCIGTAPRRERIAALALQGYLAGRTHDGLRADGIPQEMYVAKRSLQYADALIEAIELDARKEVA